MVKKIGIIMAVVFVVSIVSGFLLYVDVSNDFQSQIELKSNVSK